MEYTHCSYLHLSLKLSIFFLIKTSVLACVYVCMYVCMSNRIFDNVIAKWTVFFGQKLQSSCYKAKTNKQRQRQTGGQTGNSIQGQMLRLPGFLHW